MKKSQDSAQGRAELVVSRGHGYCWAEHPKLHVHCCHPIGHEEQGVEQHLHPYTTPATRWT